MIDELDAHSSTHRLEAFSDGVMAIAITLLIIEIGVPHVEGQESLGEKIGDLWPSYGAYILSFITIGIYWANHHSFFQLFHRTDHYFLMLNIVFLMAIAFLPFPTAVLGEYMNDDTHRDDAITFYTLGLFLPVVGWNAMWLYGRWRGLLLHGLAPRYVRQMTILYLMSFAIYGAAIGLSLIDPWIGLGACAVITGVYLLPPRQPYFVDADEPQS